MNELLTIIVISVIFLSGIIPVVMGIIYYARDNRRMDLEERAKAEKAASHQGA